jgi:hypothetical protein
MSVYALNKLCHRTQNDRDFRAAMRNDPAAAIAPYDLTQQEREALLAGDVSTLYRMGLHPFILSFLTRYEILGLTAAVYSERIRKVAEMR